MTLKHKIEHLRTLRTTEKAGRITKGDLSLEEANQKHISMDQDARKFLEPYARLMLVSYKLLNELAISENLRESLASETTWFGFGEQILVKSGRRVTPSMTLRLEDGPIFHGPKLQGGYSEYCQQTGEVQTVQKLEPVFRLGPCRVALKWAKSEAGYLDEDGQLVSRYEHCFSVNCDYTFPSPSLSEVKIGSRILMQGIENSPMGKDALEIAIVDAYLNSGWNFDKRRKRFVGS